MIEVELKFQIPEARRNAILKAVDPKKSEIIQLQAKYFDTPDRLLSQHGIALRQRLEGTRWIQTLKAASKSHIQRFEHNLDLGELEHAPDLDLSVYDTIPEAKSILNQALTTQTEGLQLQFETCIERTLRVISFEDAEIEVAVDVGVVRTETNQQDIYEVEFELKNGSVEDLLAFSFEWVKKYQLWLDVRSKAEFGNLLHQDLKVSPATLEKELNLSKKETAEKSIRHLIAHYMQHLLPNIAAISSNLAEKEHIDQAHLALNHLYLTLSLFKDWTSKGVDKWSNQLSAFKSHFENLKHYDHMQQTLGALLQNPKTAESLSKDVLYAQEKLNNLVKSTQNVQHYLELLMFSLGTSKRTQSNDLKWYAQTTLQNQYKILQDTLNAADISNFESLDELALRLNELKFSFPILTHIFDVKNLQKYGKALNDAQQAAEQYQILASSSSYLQQTELEASDWFALGWLTAKQEVYAEKLLEATEQFLVSRKFLK
ncbi:CYTH domain-containing protein [Acinetobacter shaoyimingii]|uniref:CYTH domain-containing protein n=1 Tax=Acinetobacter shaoyimingii TaxID=2715164 RepID=A0A6G8RU99_9GAMM|nr:CYTH domain-containing protein [Acinetobacter shaoyimingii]QIO05512.1 CYTH domain-containing protein [Acinetobacter shaoyimingii]